jgi:hypothetical protein
MKTQFVPLVLFRWLLILSLATISPTARAQERSYGLIFDDEGYLRLPPKPPVVTQRALRNLPTRVSYESYCPRPADQGPYSTCLAFALGYYFRTIMEAKRAGLTDPARITAMAFSPAYLYEAAKRPGDPYCRNGLRLDEAVQVLIEQGIVPLRSLTYPACGRSTGALQPQARPYRLAESQRIVSQHDSPAEKVSRLKNALAEGLPIVVSVQPTRSFETLQSDLWQPVSKEPSKSSGHAVCVLGYDDTKYGGAFRVVNSWGTDWGQGGFCWIRYDDLAATTRYAVQLFPDLNAGATYRMEGLQADVSFEQPGQGAMPLRLDEASTQAAGLLVYRMQQPYPSQTEFRFFVNNNRQAYIYALGTDDRLGSDLTKLFPYAESDDASGKVIEYSPLLAANTTVVLPPTGRIQLDSTPGTDYLLLLFSEKQLNVPALEKQFQTDAALPVLERLRRVGGTGIPPARMQYERQEARFRVNPDATGGVVPVLVLIEHR